MSTLTRKYLIWFKKQNQSLDFLISFFFNKKINNVILYVLERELRVCVKYFSHLCRFSVYLALNFFLEFNQPQEKVDSQAH